MWHIAMPVEEPSTASQADVNAGFQPNSVGRFRISGSGALRPGKSTLGENDRRGCLNGRKSEQLAFRARPTYQKQAIGRLQRGIHFNSGAT
jgi:hypothetical protein